MVTVTRHEQMFASIAAEVTTLRLARERRQYTNVASPSVASARTMSAHAK